MLTRYHRVDTYVITLSLLEVLPIWARGGRGGWRRERRFRDRAWHCRPPAGRTGRRRRQRLWRRACDVTGGGNAAERRRGNYCTGKFSNVAERRLRTSDHSGFRRASRLRRAHVGTGARQLQRNSGRYVAGPRSVEQTSELQHLIRITYVVFYLLKQN